MAFTSIFSRPDSLPQPDAPQPADTGKPERERRARRKELKAGIKEGDRLRRKAESMQGEFEAMRAQVSSIEQQADAEIKALNAELDAASDGERQREIIRSISERRIEARTRLAQLQTELRTFEVATGDAWRASNAKPTCDDLSRPGVGCPQLLARLHSARQRLQFAAGRQTVAQKTLSRLSAGHIGGDAARLRESWEFELTASENELVNAQADVDSILQSIIAE